MSDNEDFEEQIRLEEEERKKKYQFDESGNSRTRVDSDGTVYEWSEQKQAWFPKIDQDTIVQYQMSYGGYSGNQQPQAPVDTSTPEYKEWYQKYMEYWQQYASKQGQGDHASEGSDEMNKAYYEYWQKYYEYYQQQQPQVNQETDNSASTILESQTHPDTDNSTADDTNTNKDDSKKKKKKKQVEQKPAAWFEAEETPSVYVSNLPNNITEDEFKELMNKCGLIAFDPLTRKLKLKLYKDAEGNLKGDGWCCYIKTESVDLALQILDGYDVKGKKISVEKAKYQMKGNFDPSKKKRKLTSKEKQKIKAKQEKLFDWRPDAPVVGVRPKHERVVVLKNLFSPEEFVNEPEKINEVREDIRSECSKFGEVKKVVIYDHNSDGVAAVTMKSPEEADVCITALHTRWFAGRRILAENWDGKTKYEVEETEEERQKRIKQWEQFLEEDERMKRLRDEAEQNASTSVTMPEEDTELDEDEDEDEDDSANSNDNLTACTASDSNKLQTEENSANSDQ